MKTYTPNQENLTLNSDQKQIFHYCNAEGKNIFKTKEIFKTEKRVILYPYSIKTDGSITTKKIKSVELKGWNIEDIPKDIKTTGRYGFGTTRIKLFLTYLYTKFNKLEKIVIGININNRFSEKTISLNWNDLEKILKKINSEKRAYDTHRKHIINNSLSFLSSKISKQDLTIGAGQLESFLNRFDSFEKMNTNDIEALSKILKEAPYSNITITSNFIKTRDKINTIFIEEVIEKFEKLLSSISDNEKAWQTFFDQNSWILSHLFPYEVILKEKEAYVGGKTIENREGRVVDFLFQNGFKDNYALIETKTHKKALLKNKAYREPDVFAYSEDLSGGISQCLDQKNTLLSSFGEKLKIADPKVILVIGEKKSLNEHQSKCFEYLRNNQKNVDIVTFDELLAKLKGLLNVIMQK